MVPAIRVWAVSVILSLFAQTSALDATLQLFKASPGLYYDHLGEAQLYHTEWKFVTYINLQDADRSLKILKIYAWQSI
jgi:hypothetical protein